MPCSRGVLAVFHQGMETGKELPRRVRDVVEGDLFRVKIPIDLWHARDVLEGAKERIFHDFSTDPYFTDLGRVVDVRDYVDPRGRNEVEFPGPGSLVSLGGNELVLNFPAFRSKGAGEPNCGFEMPSGSRFRERKFVVADANLKKFAQFVFDQELPNSASEKWTLLGGFPVHRRRFLKKIHGNLPKPFLFLLFENPAVDIGDPVLLIVGQMPALRKENHIFVFPKLPALRKPFSEEVKGRSHWF